MNCLTWNLEWKSPAGRVGRLIQDQIRAIDPDVICYTEVIRTLVPEEGYRVEADPDYGYPNDGSRRKVVLWSRLPWTAADTWGDDEMPTGRFVSAITGGICFVGVCIPWRDAHVRTGNRNRKSWEDHISFCNGLRRFLAGRMDSGIPICVIGDYNQRIPRVDQPVNVASALTDAFPGEFQIATAGVKDAEGRNLIDHITISPGLSITMPRVIPRYTSDGTELSDHVGIQAAIEHDSTESFWG